MELTGRTVVVTGASAGIGRAVAEELSAAGCNLVLVGRRAEVLEAAAARLPGPSATLALDIAEADAGARMLALARERFGRADAVVNNAAVMAVGAIDDIDLDAVRYMISVNFGALVASSYVFAKYFKAEGSGAIVNVSSIGAYLISRRAGVYGALKHAVEAFTSSLRIELAGTGVKVGTIAPGSTASEMHDQIKSGPEERSERLDPSDVARAVRFMLEQPPGANIARLAIFPEAEAN